MNTYIALLRGINVGGKSTLPMKELVGILKGLEGSAVRTYIQSGNVVFEHAQTKPETLAQNVKQAIAQARGFAPAVMILEPTQLKDALKNCPFDLSDAQGKTIHFFFFSEQPKNPKLDSLEAVKASSEAFELGKGVFYLKAPDGIGRSKLAAKIEKALGVDTTARNLNTVRKLIEISEVDT